MRSISYAPAWVNCPEDLKLYRQKAHIWRFNIDDNSNELDHLFSTLSNDERHKSDQFHYEKHRQQFIVGRALLRKLLGKYLHQEAREIQFSYNSYGKPYLDKIDITFSVSRSNNVVVYAFSLVDEIGIDVEWLDAKFPTLEIAERFFSKTEILHLEMLSSEKRASAFFNCWTRKESYVKAKGKGLSIPLCSFEVDISSNSVAFLNFSKLFQNDAKKYEFYTFLPYSNYIASVSTSFKNADLIFFEGNF